MGTPAILPNPGWSPPPSSATMVLLLSIPGAFLFPRNLLRIWWTSSVRSGTFFGPRIQGDGVSPAQDAPILLKAAHRLKQATLRQWILEKGERMRHSLDTIASTSNIHLLLAYVADLELEVDRLRKQAQFFHHAVRGTLKRVRLLCADAAAAPLAAAGRDGPAGTGKSPPPLAEIDEAAKQLAAVLRDLQEPPGYHPAHDQVVAIAVRPLVEQVFRWQQRLLDAPQVVLRLELETEHVEWFPARLRHILDNLLSNALKYRDPDKDEAWVRLRLSVSPEGYELRISDNGVGLPPDDSLQVFELFYRAAPARAAGLGVGLAVVKLLIEQSGGTLTVDSGAGRGTTFLAILPRFDVDDYLT
jgi:light-regulated signal transduction histidine kinase (bacteriophytochrome)